MVNSYVPFDPWEWYIYPNLVDVFLFVFNGKRRYISYNINESYRVFFFDFGVASYPMPCKFT